MSRLFLHRRSDLRGAFWWGFGGIIGPTMQEIDKLQELLSKLPGIGPRQARRMAFFFLGINNAYIGDLLQTIESARAEKMQCGICNKLFFTKNKSAVAGQCERCTQVNEAGGTTLMIVAKQPDQENAAKVSEFDGYLYILGRLVKLSEKEPEKWLPLEHISRVIKDQKVTEVIFALPLNPEGENTKDIVLDYLKQHADFDVNFTTLGRGMSSGSEVEYADPETIAAAIKNRT